jgi:uncharacterized circularly permuted ATP-grasp superfamily protein
VALPGHPAAGRAFLHLYAVDLARTPDGRWWVTADRTQAPSGAGYALENRTIVSRAFPELYRDLKVQHLAGFFRTLQETLARQAPATTAPLVVLLTPGASTKAISNTFTWRASSVTRWWRAAT